ncbi:MAG: DUF5593 domain-containing protein [Nocardia sp.]|nr:DUF5593 domain-containing protein [Nocardia sp.]
MWYLVDVADTARPVRYVASEGKVGERRLHRAIRPNSLAVAAQSMIEQCAATGELGSSELLVRGVRYVVLTVPVAGPGEEVLAVQMWVGEAGIAPPPPPDVDAFVWDGPRWVVFSSGRGGTVLPVGHDVLHGAWLMSRIIECEGRDRLMTAALDPEPGVRWSGAMEVLTVDGARTARVFGWFRYHRDGALCGLLLRVQSDREPGIVLPTYHHDAAAALLGGTTALVDTQRMRLVDWLTPPISGIAWLHHPSSAPEPDSIGDLEFELGASHPIHPEDRERYLGLLLELAAGRTDEARATVRLLAVTGHWQPVDLYCVRLPRASPRFVTVLIRLVGDPAR